MFIDDHSRQNAGRIISLIVIYGLFGLLLIA